ncbi:hypothetical protein GE115_13445 [Agromyces sp. CFH 90414]|uniref:DUF2178 domain-containing protein n=2 Tax=Agromyces agglutinans TaxID=2662258 RepID=A0A6I2F967_9MICO|nr:hypothetical protein [Agromyces agglutinans]
MSYEEKGVWSFLAIAVVGYGVYLALVIPRLMGAPIDEVDYVWPMVWTIGGAIVAGIVGRIVIEIVSPSETRERDVRDTEIDRMGERIGGSFITIGALGALVLTWFGLDGFWVANTLYLGFVVAAVLSSFAKLAAYRQGGFQSW